MGIVVGGDHDTQAASTERDQRKNPVFACGDKARSLGLGGILLSNGREDWEDSPYRETMSHFVSRTISHFRWASWLIIPNSVDQIESQEISRQFPPDESGE